MFEEVKFISPFVSPKLVCETESIPSPLLEPKSCPSGHPNIVLGSDRDSTLTLHDRFHAMDMPKAPNLETNDSTVKHECFSFATLHFSCSLVESPEFVVLSTTCNYEDPNHLSLLVYKLSRRMVVDAYIYHKYCKSRGCTMVLSLQLELYYPMLGGEDGNYTTIDSFMMKFLRSSLRP
jgi:hypothetical protein